MKSKNALLLLGIGAGVAVALSAFSPKARMMRLFRSITGRQENRVLWAQMMDNNDKQGSIEAVEQEFGMLPAVVGGDYWMAGTLNGFEGGQRWQEYNAAFERFAQRGCMVTLHAYFGAPGVAKEWGSQRNRDWDFSELQDESSERFADFMSMLRVQADGLENLQRKGIVVLFRPWAEMNGPWFWWGARSREEFLWLWNKSRDYLLRERKLHNLLWVFCGNGRSPTSDLEPVMTYYPGDEKVDIVALDFYSQDHASMREDDYEALVATGKPFCFAEYGWTVDYSQDNFVFDNREYINAIRAKFPKTFMFQSWDYINAVRNQLYARELLNDPWVATLRDV